MSQLNHCAAKTAPAELPCPLAKRNAAIRDDCARLKEMPNLGLWIDVAHYFP
jgi:hypothetical protein